ncbi:hypothetical protein Droror1_Dr00016280 [Drosera rotundifolia]
MPNRYLGPNNLAAAPAGPLSRPQPVESRTYAPSEGLPPDRSGSTAAKVTRFGLPMSNNESRNSGVTSSSWDVIKTSASFWTKWIGPWDCSYIPRKVVVRSGGRQELAWSVLTSPEIALPKIASPDLVSPELVVIRSSLEASSPLVASSPTGARLA